MLYLKKISTIGKMVSPSLLWNFSDEPNSIYLTFDDGPIPEVTPWVLETLKKYDAKATFFCIGDNVKKHPKIFRQILSEGHQIGNHTNNHLNGWKTSTKEYLENFHQAEEVIQEEIQNSKFKIQNKLFRPPYGKIKPSQIKEVQKEGFKIVMWEVIAGDFDVNLTAQNCYENVINNCKPGSIVVFHDSLKAEKNIKETLPKVLEYYQQKEFEFKRIPLAAQ